jgi:hypothetical protein
MEASEYIQKLLESPEENVGFYRPGVISYYDHLKTLEQFPGCMSELNPETKQGLIDNLRHEIGKRVHGESNGKEEEGQGFSFIHWYVDMKKLGFQKDLDLVKEGFRRSYYEDCVDSCFKIFSDRLDDEEKNEGISSLCSILVRKGEIRALKNLLNSSGIKVEFDKQDVNEGYNNLQYSYEAFTLYGITQIKPTKQQAITLFKREIEIYENDSDIIRWGPHHFKNAIEIFKEFIDQDQERIKRLEEGIERAENYRKFKLEWALGECVQEKGYEDTSPVVERGREAERKLNQNIIEERLSGREIFIDVIEEYEVQIARE